MEDKNIKKNTIFSVIIFILWISEVVLACEIYTWYIAIIDRGYDPTEITYFAKSFGWLPIALVSVAFAMFIAEVIAYAAKRRKISFKSEAIALVSGILVCLFYAFPITTFGRDITLMGYKVMTIISCILFALYLLCRGMVSVVNFYKNRIKLKIEN